MSSKIAESEDGIASKSTKISNLGDVLAEGLPAIMSLPRAQQQKILETEKKLAALDCTWRCWIHDQTNPKLDPFTLTLSKNISVIDLKKLIRDKIHAASKISPAASKTGPSLKETRIAKTKKYDGLSAMNLVYQGIALQHNAALAEYVKSKPSKNKTKIPGRGAAFGWGKPYIGSIWIVPSLVMPSNGAIGGISRVVKRTASARNDLTSSKPKSFEGLIRSSSGVVPAAGPVAAKPLSFGERYLKLVKRQQDFNKSRNAKAIEQFGQVVSRVEQERIKREAEAKKAADARKKTDEAMKKSRQQMKGREYRSSRARVQRDRR